MKIGSPVTFQIIGVMGKLPLAAARRPLKDFTPIEIKRVTIASGR
jgi:hypothetical protein